MVHADADGRVMLLTYMKERDELRLDLLQLLGIFLVGVLQVLEGTSWVDVVAGIDTHLLTILCSDISRMCREVDVSHKRRHIAVGLQPRRDVLHVLGFTGTLCREAHQFTTGIDDALGLGHAAFGVVGVGGCHRLDADGVVATYGDVAHMDNRASSSCTHISLLLSLC